jgi:hypothetical protein
MEQQKPKPKTDKEDMIKKLKEAKDKDLKTGKIIRK